MFNVEVDIKMKENPFALALFVRILIFVVRDTIRTEHEPSVLPLAQNYRLVA